MGKIIKGTNGDDIVIQSRLGINNSALQISTFGGNDQIKLDRTGDLGGDNRVDAGTGKDVVVNLFEGGNRIALGDGNDIYVGTGFSTLNDFDVVSGGLGNDRFFVSTFISDYLGGGGKDFFASNGWQNRFDGGAGIDTISYEFRHEDSVVGDTGVTIDLAAGLVQTGAIRQEVILNFENARGSLLADAIGGTDGGNVLQGLAGDDDLFGFGGNDRIEGGLGSDFLTGGSGADLFIFRKASESTAFSPDQIFDFNRAEGDRISLSAIDANVLESGNQGFAFIGAAAFTAAGQVRFSGGQLQINTDNDVTAEMVVNIQSVASMLASDFLL